MSSKSYFLLFSFLCIFASCGKQDSVYKEFVQEGGLIYPAKPINVEASRGYQRIVLKWDKPMDPSIRTARVFWDNYTHSKDFSYSDYPEGSIQTVIDDLEDRSYTFDVVNYDADGNKSLAEEITTSPFGESWLVSHAERMVKFSKVEGTDLIVTLKKPTDEVAVTKFRYTNSKGEVVERGRVLSTENEIVLPDAMAGKYFEVQSAYCASEGIDTVWTGNWVRTEEPSATNVDRTRASVSVTSNQIRESFRPDLVIDGIKDNPSSRWYRSNNRDYRNVFPKILVIDTKEIGDNVKTFNKFVFYQDPDPDGQTRRFIRSVNIYVSDTKFNPDDTNFSKNFGEPVVSGSLNQVDAVQELVPETRVAGRYIAVVFRSSYNSNGFIDLWEFEAFGYAAALTD